MNKQGTPSNLETWLSSLSRAEVCCIYQLYRFVALDVSTIKNRTIITSLLGNNSFPIINILEGVSAHLPKLLKDLKKTLNAFRKGRSKINNNGDIEAIIDLIMEQPEFSHHDPISTLLYVLYFHGNQNNPKVGFQCFFPDYELFRGKLIAKIAKEEETLKEIKQFIPRQFDLTEVHFVYDNKVIISPINATKGNAF